MKSPRRGSRRVKAPDYCSIMLSQEACLGVFEYLGDDEDWGFALYDTATETWTPALLRTGQPTGHPNDAFDTAAIIHLVDYQQ